jgi:predicted secreted protein
MNWVSLLAIYFVVWWILLFAVLPWGLKTQEEEGEVVLGTTASAPARPRLLVKALWTSIVSAAVVGLFWLAVERYGLSLPMLANWFDMRR